MHFLSKSLEESHIIFFSFFCVIVDVYFIVDDFIVLFHGVDHFAVDAGKWLFVELPVFPEIEILEVAL